MRAVEITPLLNTTVFGPVATGSMKAQLALIAAGTIMISGESPAANAPAASTGISSAVLAVLEVVSVIRVTTKQVSTISA